MINIVNRLYFGDGLSYEKIAEITQLPLSYILININKSNSMTRYHQYGKQIPMHDDEMQYASNHAEVQLSKLKYDEVKDELL